MLWVVKVFIEGVEADNATEAESKVHDMLECAENVECMDLSRWEVYVVAEDDPMSTGD